MPPPLPQILPPVSPLPAPAPALPSLLRVFVREIRLTGNTVFSDTQLATITAPYVTRELTTEDLEALRLDLTRLYIDHGYITSGAIIPDQTVTDGVITVHLIEGRLHDIEVAGQRWFRSGYFRQRLALGAGPPVSILRLQERLQLLDQDERIAQIHAELRPGVQRGESVLHVQVTENLPYSASLEFNNYQSPTVGAERGLLSVAHRNLTGHGDILSAQFGYSAGTDLQVDAGYAFPLDLQLTTDPLFPLEQIAVGGRFSVRGYRENQLVRDNGLIVAFESHLPLVRRKPWAHVLQLVPFVDFGKAWDHQGATPDPQMLVSVGIGLHWIVTLMSRLRWQPQLEVYWGYRLTDVETADDNLQDLGLHIRFVITAF